MRGRRSWTAEKPNVYTRNVEFTHTACQALPARADVSAVKYFLVNLLLPLARSLAVQARLRSLVEAT